MNEIEIDLKVKRREKVFPFSKIIFLFDKVREKKKLQKGLCYSFVTGVERPDKDQRDNAIFSLYYKLV